MRFVVFAIAGLVAFSSGHSSAHGPPKPAPAECSVFHDEALADIGDLGEMEPAFGGYVKLKVFKQIDLCLRPILRDRFDEYSPRYAYAFHNDKGQVAMIFNHERWHHTAIAILVDPNASSILKACVMAEDIAECGGPVSELPRWLGLTSQ